jgi:hypothetical protein
MALLVDEAIWPWRGRRWAHLVSDSHLDELHDLAHRIGLPYLAFQGDHYDVHEDLRAAAIAAGAVPTPGRDLVRALRAAGLRRRGTPSWQWVARRPVGGGSGAAGAAAVLDELATIGPRLAAEDLDRLAAAIEPLAEIDEVGRAERQGEVILVASSTIRHERVVGGIEVVSASASVHLTAGERGTFAELVVVAPASSRAAV